jgi:hypothetical protein
MSVLEWVSVLMWVDKCKSNLDIQRVLKGNFVGLNVERNREGKFLFK